MFNVGAVVSSTSSVLLIITVYVFVALFPALSVVLTAILYIPVFVKVVDAVFSSPPFIVYTVDACPLKASVPLFFAIYTSWFVGVLFT